MPGDLQALEGEMSSRLGLRVSIEPKDDGRAGSVTIRYQSLDQFDDLLRRLGLSQGRSQHQIRSAPASAEAGYL